MQKSCFSTFIVKKLQAGGSPILSTINDDLESGELHGEVTLDVFEQLKQYSHVQGD